MDFSILIPFTIYLLSMIAIGCFFYNRTQNTSEYFLGGRQLNYWVTSLSAQASDMSGWLLLGLPGYAYLAGLEAAWIGIGLIVGTFLNWQFIAARLRRATHKFGDAITLSEYFENIFHAKTHALRFVSAVFILIFFLIYTASGFVAGAKLFSSVFDLSYIGALVVGVSVIMLYTFLGGFWAVCTTDFIQGVIMFFAIIFVPVMMIHQSGGWSASVQAVQAIHADFFNMFTTVAGKPLSWITIVSSLAWGLGYFGQPHILARFMAIRNVDEIPKARTIAMLWVILTLAAAVLVGMFAVSFLPDPLAAADSETVFIVLVNKMFVPLVAGFLLAAILAAIMSTADSQLLVASSAITEDFYRLFLRRRATNKELVWISRFSVILIAFIAFIIALDPQASVLHLVAYAWAGFGAAFGPVIIVSLFSRRVGAGAALSGILVGGITVLIWEQLSGGIFDLYEIVPGFIFSFLAIFLSTFWGQLNEKKLG